MSTPSFEDALAAIRDGADYSLSGRILTVNGITLAITDEEFDAAWDTMEEVDGVDSMIRLNDEPSDDEIYNRPGVEGGIAYPLGPEPMHEHDWRL